jgi:hypothetical protein
MLPEEEWSTAPLDEFPTNELLLFDSTEGVSTVTSGVSSTFGCSTTVASVFTS